MTQVERRQPARVLATPCGIPWLGFVVYPTHRLLKRRNAVRFTRRLERNLDAYQVSLDRGLRCHST